MRCHALWAMEKIVPVLIPAAYVLMLVLERVFPARELPEVRGWDGASARLGSMLVGGDVGEPS
jgi:hypothetical protein